MKTPEERARDALARACDLCRPDCDCETCMDSIDEVAAEIRTAVGEAVRECERLAAEHDDAWAVEECIRARFPEHFAEHFAEEPPA